MTKSPEELTKDWKAGKLDDGLYYIRLENQKTLIDELETWYRTNIEESKEYYETEQAFFGYSNNMISEVLAPVPSYEEYKALQEQLDKEGIWYTKISYKKLEKENNNLRALLRECKPYLSYFISNNKHVGFTPDAANLLTRINAALGESEKL